MKKNLKKDYKNKEIEEIVLGHILKATNWQGSFMRFPYKNNKGLLRFAHVYLKIKWNRK